VPSVRRRTVSSGCVGRCRRHFPNEFLKLGRNLRRRGFGALFRRCFGCGRLLSSSGGSFVDTSGCRTRFDRGSFVRLGRFGSGRSTRAGSLHHGFSRGSWRFFLCGFRRSRSGRRFSFGFRSTSGFRRYRFSLRQKRLHFAHGPLDREHSFPVWRCFNARTNLFV